MIGTCLSGRAIYCNISSPLTISVKLALSIPDNFHYISYIVSCFVATVFDEWLFKFLRYSLMDSIKRTQEYLYTLILPTHIPLFTGRSICYTARRPAVQLNKNTSIKQMVVSILCLLDTNRTVFFVVASCILGPKNIFIY